MLKEVQVPPPLDSVVHRVRAGDAGVGEAAAGNKVQEKRLGRHRRRKRGDSMLLSGVITTLMAYCYVDAFQLWKQVQSSSPN
ncbi:MULTISPECIES: hypothetical protein [unclassified Caballeronia]|uniref:hypothetical protein n=1 Tax=unclassified Caballeronia TaxID=2646786 RepID=UPI00285F0CD2|nr:MULTISPECIES: hypothetical protein [unclassified Caballeronia]MDR5752418.1 hypothetical protein [Caballeronia sp. LZ024]MDR5845224.1 hypothetical protein [Caballeronia sp. LZ031]